MRKLVLSFTVIVLAITGCATNPVTGKRQLKLVSDAQLIAMGTQQYAPTRQMQGGDYEIDPQLTAYVREVGNAVASATTQTTGVNLPYEFVVLNNSIPNAWAMPGGKIAINRGLLTELNSEAELAAVLGHEVIHAAANHSASAMSQQMLLQGALIALQVSQHDNKYGQYVVGGAQIGAQLISTKYGRDKELESDFYGMQSMADAGYDPDAAVELQQTFVRLSEQSGRRDDWLSGLFSTHPPSVQRVATNRQTAATLPDGGTYGRERYQAMTAGIRAAKPAYEAYDKGVKALREGQVQQAEQFARRALELEPRESKFYGLIGDVHLQSRDWQTAIDYYNAALEKNSNFFQTWLTRGMATLELGNWQAAEDDLQQSIRLLPTATAYHRLGMIALNTGRSQEAVKYLEQAASSDSDVGRDAQARLARLQIESEPERFIGGQIGVNNSGYVIIQVVNKAPIAITNVELAIVAYDEAGNVAENRPVGIRETLGPNQAMNINSGIGPVTDAAQLQRIRVVVRRAEAAD
ncbi:MAG: M48 family metalloprotease [Gammaproteobacteria bacterium]|nr:M48 family metalloprotease [Gammaproteobacteria bacterium]